MRSVSRRYIVVGSAILLLGCSDYETAVACSAAFRIANEQSPGGENARLQRLAEADAAEHASNRKPMSDLQADIRSSEIQQRSQLTGGQATIFRSRTFEECWTQYQ